MHGIWVLSFLLSRQEEGLCHACEAYRSAGIESLLEPTARQARGGAAALSVAAVLLGGALNLSSIALALAGAIGLRHRGKSVDRLLGNGGVQEARASIYGGLAHLWLCGLPQVLLVVDWSDLTPDQRWHWLRAGLYAQRMIIEESFRDTKNLRWGQGLHTTRSRSRERLQILLLIAHLASFVQRLIGEDAKARQLELQFSPTNCTSRARISVLVLARRILDGPSHRLDRLTPWCAIPPLTDQARAAWASA